MASDRAAAEDLVLLLFVDSILRTGILNNGHTSAKSNSELVRSLDSLLESALACPKHPSKPLSPASPTSPNPSSSSQETSIFHGISFTKPDPAYQECEAEPSYSYYPAKEKSGRKPSIMTIPAREAIVQEPAVRFSETREALDVTAKFFYLPSTSEEPAHFDPAWIQESLEHLKTATGLTDIDTFIISFPGLQFAECPSNCDNTESTIRRNGTAYPPLPEDDLRKQIEDVWRAASANKHLKSLGVSEFSLERLQWLFAQSGEDATKGVVTSPSGLRKPRVGQVNTRHNCDVPQDLIDFAKKEELELLVHSDCSDFLPPKTFTRLLARHGSRLPAPLISPTNGSSVDVSTSGAQDPEQLARNTLQSMSARWVLKYTVFIRDRALLADKGYIVKATRPA